MFYETLEGGVTLIEQLCELVQEGEPFRFDYLKEQVVSDADRVRDKEFWEARGGIPAGRRLELPKYGVHALLRDMGRLMKAGYVEKVSSQTYRITPEGQIAIERIVGEVL